MAMTPTDAITVKTRSEQRCFSGTQGFYSHASASTGTDMNFSVFVPAGAADAPALYFLAGLTCSEETFVIKAGAQRLAAELGLVLVTCDTSPRGLGYDGEDDDWDFGTGAGFYLNATAEPWRNGYQMGRYINDELPAVVEANFPVSPTRRGIFGHSMGGHGALVTALRNPDRWHSVSAFAPINNPVNVPWGQKAFSHYLGDDREQWREWDACEWILRQPLSVEILVDQGLIDQFLERELSVAALEAACASSGQPVKLRRHPGYDHSYYFIQSFVDDHLRHHAATLLANSGQ